MNLEIVVVLTVVLIILVCLITEIAKLAFIVFCALAVLILTGILTPSDALKGFSNEGMLTVALLFIVAGAVQQSGVLIISRALGSGNNLKRSLFQMMLPISAMSAFFK
ncbi:hypothetical protein [Halalkalibacterium ligniniphilum]|uniref:hypothetical protein n=1 Tax=Halalkalibacterium ligniniphilum TaxID=1134413 RepID=UPI00034C1DA4|nr:hypothetical protein [Halalkalibacterium ligniniphilum]